MARELRGDIQGLRAVAVLVVIAAHAGVPFLPGGFIGVDVFYVVSGYLIAGLLYREVMVTGSISIGAFWGRRARRILPAATLVTIATVGASLIWLSLLDARQVVVDSLWATAFAANIHFAAIGTDYFAHGQPPSPLQHYWSLAVEEQFYVAWPLILLFCLLVARVVRRRPVLQNVERLPRATVVTVLVAISLASFAWSIHQTVASPTTAYFSTFTRAWELGVGTLMALVAPSAVRQLSRRSLELVAGVGAFAVAGSCVVISDRTPFPGIAAALPVAGTALLLLAGSASTSTLVGKLLRLRPMRTIGDWSYSLYLWHWPLLIIPAEALHRGLSPLERLLAVATAFVFSGLSYTFVESPFRIGRPAHRLHRSRALLLYPVSALLVVATTAGAWAWTGYRGGEHGHTPAIAADSGDLQASGEDHTLALVRASVTAARDKMSIPSNLTPNLLNLRNSVANVGACDYTHNVRKLCQAGDPNGTRTLVVIGDSHARAWIPAFDRISQVGRWQAYYLVMPQCTAAHVEIASTESDDPFTDCSEFQTWVIQQVQALHPDLVVVASSPPVNGVFVNGKRVTSVAGITPALRAGYDDLFFQLAEYADQVALIRDVPKSPDDPATCLGTGSPNLSSCMFTPVERSTELGNVAVASAEAANIEVVDPTPWLCWQGECPVVIGGTLSYRDTDHITTEYAANLWAELGRALHMLPTT
jgi:peptidoglycan/LPS O-acetylase OafA/YrhL